MFNTNLKNVSFSNTLTFALVVLVLQITTVFGMKILVLLLLAIAPRIQYLVMRSLVQHSH